MADLVAPSKDVQGGGESLSLLHKLY